MWVEDLRDGVGEALEALLNVCSSAGASLEESGQEVLIGHHFAFFCRNRSFAFHVTFVSDDYDRNRFFVAFLDVLFYAVDPVTERFVRLAIGYIVHQEKTLCVSVLKFRHAPEPLLSGRIPDLKMNPDSVHNKRNFYIINTDGGQHVVTER